MARRRGQQKGYLHIQGSMWCLSFREDALDGDGQLVRVRKTVRIASTMEVTKREARRLANEILDQVDEAALLPSSLITLGDFVARRFEPDVVWSLKPAGKKHYHYILGEHVVPALGELRLRDVNSDHVQALVKAKIEGGYSVQTAVHMRNAVSAVFNHAKAKKAYSGDNPTIGVRLPEMQRKETRSLDFQQGKALLDHLASPAREMALLSMTGSLNVAEMLGLRWRHLNLTGSSVIAGSELVPPLSLIVRENWYRGERCSVKAKSRRRTVPLSTSVVACLAAMQQRPHHTSPDDPVFCSRTGQPLNENNLMKRSVKPAAEQLGMPWVSWHVFRHTHATLGEQIGMALSDRQAQMGHADVRMTLHYTHSDLDRRRPAIEQMATLLVGEARGTVN